MGFHCYSPRSLTPAPSAGTYGYEPHVTYFFGIPRTIEPGGVVMDLDRVANITNTDGKGHDAWKDFNFQLGGLSSALEHGIPEQMFVTPENPGLGHQCRQGPGQGDPAGPAHLSHHIGQSGRGSAQHPPQRPDDE